MSKKTGGAIHPAVDIRGLATGPDVTRTGVIHVVALEDYLPGAIGTLKSSFRDWAAEETDHPREVIEAALAHVVRNQTEAAYARSDLFARRRRLMDDWAAYLDGKRQSVDPTRDGPTTLRTLT